MEQQMEQRKVAAGNEEHHDDMGDRSAERMLNLLGSWHCLVFIFRPFQAQELNR